MASQIKCLGLILLVLVALAGTACSDREPLPTLVPLPTYTPLAPLPTYTPMPTYTPVPRVIPIMGVPKKEVVVEKIVVQTVVVVVTATPLPAKPVPTARPVKAVMAKAAATAKPVAATVQPDPTAVPTATATPNPLQVEFVVHKATDWDFRGTGEYLYNCYDLKTINTNNVPIDLSYSLTALDSDGVNYTSGSVHIQSLSGLIRHLEPGQTYYDKRCWGTDPVTRMELSIDELMASTILGDDLGVGEWQKIGDGGNLEQYIKFISEPWFPAGYPEENYGMRWTSWDVANTSETKTLHVRTCVAWLWREPSMYRQSRYGDGASILASIAADIQTNTLFSNVCTDSRISPKTKETLDTNTYLAATDWLYPNLYEKILGIWVREEN